MAAACHVQKTYLSKVLNDRGHLSSDQLYLACEYLGFSDAERHYLLKLFEESKTDLPKRKAELKLQIQKLRKDHSKTESHIRAKVMATAGHDLTDYYLDPMLQVIHMFLTVDQYARHAAQIADKLHLDSESLAHALRKLQQLGIVEMRAGRYYVIRDNIHLPKDSTLYKPYRNLLRIKSNEWVNKLPQEKSYNFSVIFSTSPAAKQKIHNAFLEFLKTTQKLVEASKSEEVYQLNFDLFGWSE